MSGVSDVSGSSAGGVLPYPLLLSGRPRLWWLVSYAVTLVGLGASVLVCLLALGERAEGMQAVLCGVAVLLTIAALVGAGLVRRLAWTEADLAGGVVDGAGRYDGLGSIVAGPSDETPDLVDAVLRAVVLTVVGVFVIDASAMFYAAFGILGWCMVLVVAFRVFDRLPSSGSRVGLPEWVLLLLPLVPALTFVAKTVVLAPVVAVFFLVVVLLLVVYRPTQLLGRVR